MADCMWVGREYSSFKEFEESLHAHSQATFTTWVKLRSNSIQRRNEKIQKKSRPPLDDRLEFNYVIYTCKHAGQVRRRAKPGESVRPNQSTYKTGCPGQIDVYADAATNKLVIKRLNTEHNHVCDKVSFLHHPEQRRLEKAKLERVKCLLGSGQTVQNIQEHLHSTEGHFVTSKDIHNVRGKMKRELQVLRGAGKKKHIGPKEPLAEQVRESKPLATRKRAGGVMDPNTSNSTKKSNCLPTESQGDLPNDHDPNVSENDSASCADRSNLVPSQPLPSSTIHSYSLPPQTKRKTHKKAKTCDTEAVNRALIELMDSQRKNSQLLESADTLLSDSDHSFFVSCASRMKNLPAKTKSYVKLQISQLLFNAENRDVKPIPVTPLPAFKRDAMSVCVRTPIMPGPTHLPAEVSQTSTPQAQAPCVIESDLPVSRHEDVIATTVLMSHMNQ